MANSFQTKFIGDLTEQEELSDSAEIMVYDDSDGKLHPWSKVLNTIKNKILEWTFETLNTTAKTLVGAVNELKKGSNYTAGDSFSTRANNLLPGMISGASKSIVFTVCCDKPVEADSVSVTCKDFTARGITGYLLTDVDLSNYTVTVAHQGTYITVIVTADTAFNVTNNTPVCVEGAITFSFS